MATKKNKKSPQKKTQKKKVAPAVKRNVSHEIVVKVQSVPTSLSPVPTVQELAEPMKDGKKLTMQKTWLVENQLLKMLQRTPKEQVHKRKGRGGKEFDYVEGQYCIKWLNFSFGWNWDYESVNEPSAAEIIDLIEKKIDQIWVTGKLTVHSSDNRFTITKMQSGKADIKFLKDTRKPVSIGDDLKAAHTDAMKKCASLLGFASDIYGKAEYKESTGQDVPDVAPGAALPPPSNNVVLKKDQVMGPEGKPVYLCQVCEAPLSDSGAQFSKRMCGKYLCKEHFDELQAKNKKK